MRNLLRRKNWTLSKQSEFGISHSMCSAEVGVFKNSYFYKAASRIYDKKTCSYLAKLHHLKPATFQKNGFLHRYFSRIFMTDTLKALNIWVIHRCFSKMYTDIPERLISINVIIKQKKKLFKNVYFDFFPLVFFLAQYGQNHFLLGWTSNPRQLKWYIFITHDLSEQVAVSDNILIPASTSISIGNHIFFNFWWCYMSSGIPPS